MRMHIAESSPGNSGLERTWEDPGEPASPRAAREIERCDTQVRVCERRENWGGVGGRERVPQGL